MGRLGTGKIDLVQYAGWPGLVAAVMQLPRLTSPAHDTHLVSFCTLDREKTTLDHALQKKRNVKSEKIVPFNGLLRYFDP
ncbi:hypothetical protein [Acidovorax sp.]|uniref:hypothetical protein n=1 Tax=Acidovorax sp. TaxID=1872122 RepID=UPI00391F356C